MEIMNVSIGTIVNCGNISKMVKILYYCCLLLHVPLLTALCTENGQKFKKVCLGHNVDLFQNIASISSNTHITLYKHLGKDHDTLGAWVLRNITYTATIDPKYHQKVSLENDSIVLKDFQQSDEATYTVIASSTRKDVQLCALIPPTTRCNLDIKQEDTVLIAFLNNPEYCGKPLTSAVWMKKPNVFYRSHDIIEVPALNQSETYRACIEGETLKCVTDSSKSHYCKNVTIKQNSRVNCLLNDNSTNNCASLTYTPQLKTISTSTEVIVPFVLVIVTVILILIIVIHFEKLSTCRRGQSARARNAPEEVMLEETRLNDTNDNTDV